MLVDKTTKQTYSSSMSAIMSIGKNEFYTNVKRN